jgi:hypothetical protein
MEKDLLDKLEKINKECPLIPHTNAGRMFSMVRRMKAEKEMKIPQEFRSGFAISVKTGKHTNEMTAEEWKEFYASMVSSLKEQYPELYEQIFKQ